MGFRKDQSLRLFAIFYCVLSFLYPIRARKPREDQAEAPNSPTSFSSQEKSCGCIEVCSWILEQYQYSLEELCDKEYDVKLNNPRNANIKFSPCGQIQCNGVMTKGCINVPGISPTSTGQAASVQVIEKGLFISGFQLVLDEGETCEVTKKPRKTILNFPCDPNRVTDLSSFKPLKAYEGDRKETCCYYVEFPSSQLGCPIHIHSRNLIARTFQTTIEAVTGCVNSDPLKTISSCHYNGGNVLSIHGIGFSEFCGGDVFDVQGIKNQRNQLRINRKYCSDYIQNHFCVFVGEKECLKPIFENIFMINCTLSAGSGVGLDVMIVRRATNKWHEGEEMVPENEGRTKKYSNKDKDKILGDNKGKCEFGEIITMLSGAVSYKEVINFRDKFNQFVEYGVGGLKKEIEELYRRAFASRGASPDVLAQLGITHIKGILLYGPPGAGKTLLARTIAKILGSKQVQLINGPEIISKYLGESERNLRGYFESAHQSYKNHGDASELYVIIIDEIEAICKPRGKTDQSAAGAAYDSLVNQLLTLLDGLSEVNNVLVIGMTNRKELMDPALLRPGRFEVLIEVELPDEEGRREIFEIHTRSMRESGSLSSDVSISELAANTTRFSGAEIAGVVRAAASYALDRQQSNEDISQTLLVTAEDFQLALETISPAYTHSQSHVMSRYLPPVFMSLGTAHENIITSLLDLLHSLQYNSITRIQTALIYGPKGTGKTSLAAHIAVLGHFTFVKIITASSMIGLPDVQKVDILQQAFKDATRSESSLIVLDDLHRILEYIQIGSQVSVSHSMMHAVTTLLSISPPKGSCILVIGTMTVSNTEELAQPSGLGLHTLFTWQYLLPSMDSSSISVFLTSRHISRQGGGQLTLPSNLQITVKHLLHSIECACSGDSSCSSTSSLPSYLNQRRFIECIMSLSSRVSQENQSTNIFSE